jgi:hypothetical protein
MRMVNRAFPVDHLVRLGELRRRRGAAVYLIQAVVKHIGYRYNHEYNKVAEHGSPEKLQK